MIKMISVRDIFAHPNNPRKDLGDLTELAESIKESGILQNLTIVPAISTITKKPFDGDPIYTVVIGHRRLAAAKIAGLEEVPCVIADMDEKTQIATMLLENMQRSDLTVYEQAQGFQMMIDLGESVTDISEKTGFSESTVYRRMKLLELDQGKLKESASRGATLSDYIELEKIKDIETRNRVLGKIGTNDFNYELKKAIDEEENQRKFDEMLNEIKKFATEVEDTEGLEFKGSYYCGRLVETPEDVNEIEYFYTTSGNFIYLYSEHQEQSNQEDEEKTKEEQQRQEMKMKVEEITERTHELRTDFIKSISNATAKKKIAIIVEFALYTMLEQGYGYANYQDVVELLDYEVKINEGEDGIELNNLIEDLNKKPELYLLLTVYSKLGGRGTTLKMNYFDWRYEYSENRNLDKTYELLEKLGYELSEEEQSLKNGTHELYIREENKDE